MSKRNPLGSLLAIFMALCLFACVSLQDVPQTAAGVQCPTAPVQLVVTEKVCCSGGNPSLHSEAPKPGNRFFVQCRCAEKRAAQQLSAAPNRVELFTAAAPLHVAPQALLIPHSLDRYHVGFASEARVPAIRPPVVI